MKRISRQTKFLDQEHYLELYRRFIRDTEKGTRVKKNGKRIRPATVDTYRYVYKLLEDFISATSFELRLYLADRLNTKEKEQAKKYYKYAMEQRGYMDQSIAKINSYKQELNSILEQ